MIPFDNSKHAGRAFGWALTFATQFGASIYIVSVTQKKLNRSIVYETPGREKLMSKNSIDALEDGIGKFKEQALKFHIKIDSEIIASPSIAETILSRISSKKINLVVMGTRGFGMAKEMMLGRVSTNISLNAPCPVILVK